MGEGMYINVSVHVCIYSVCTYVCVSASTVHDLSLIHI